MKTKSKLVLGLSILSAATLAAGATSTFAWYQATISTNPTADYGSQATASVLAPTDLQQDAGAVTITFAAAEVSTTSGKALQLSEYGKRTGSNNSITLYTAAGYKENTGTAGFYHAVISAGGSVVYEPSTGYSGSKYGKEATGESGFVDFRIFRITATADSAYQANADLQAGFVAYNKTLSFTPITGGRTYYWCSDGTTEANLSATPFDETQGEAVAKTIAVSLAAEWNGQETVVGYVAVAAHGINATSENTADGGAVSVGFTAMSVN